MIEAGEPVNAEDLIGLGPANGCLFSVQLRLDKAIIQSSMRPRGSGLANDPLSDLDELGRVAHGVEHMRRSRLGMVAMKATIKAALMACIAFYAVALSGCAAYYPAHLKPLPAQTRALMAEKGMTEQQPILIRIFKSESELEIWKEKDDGHFYHLKTYPICNFSGGLGPKQKQGDLQAPEGFYVVDKSRLNPKSRYHLSFNMGYPNAYDRAYGRTGANLMVHGDCKSRGCYAMTDAVVEEIYALAQGALLGGQEKFQVHAFPFRMTAANLKAHNESHWYKFWSNLKEGYDYFEATRLPPLLAVCGKRYVVNAVFADDKYPNPKRACPRFSKQPIIAFKPGSTKRAPVQSVLAKPLGSVMALQFGDITPVYNVMTLGPATPEPSKTSQDKTSKGKAPKKKAAAKATKKVAQKQ